MPAQSPTLSPTLSAMVAALRGSSSGMPCLDLADEVGADVGGLGEDAAADPHEHCQQRRAEAEAFEDLGGVALVEDDDDGGAEQAEADGEHTDDTTGAERDLDAVVTVAAAGRLGDAHIGLNRQAHAEIADRGREQGTDDEEERHDVPPVVQTTKNEPPYAVRRREVRAACPRRRRSRRW
jgi:hypothetical protein